MSDDGNFDLKPAGDAAEAAPTPLRRTARGRSTGKRRDAKKARRGDAASTAAPTGGVLKFLGWIVSPTFYYAVGFVFSVVLLLSLYNPTWGVLAKVWPHDVLGAGPFAFEWNEHTTRILALLSLTVATCLALLMKPGRTRGIIVLAALTLVLSRFQPLASNLYGHILPIAIALTAGALLVRRRTGRTVLFLGVVLVAGQMLMPWDSARAMRKNQVSSAYVSTLQTTIDYYGNPPEEFLQDGGWPRVVMQLLPQTIGLAILAIGLLALLGLGGRWARWTAGCLMLLVFVGPLIHMWLAGLDRGNPDDLSAWQLGLGQIARELHASAMAYALLIAGVVADIGRPRAGSDAA